MAIPIHLITCFQRELDTIEKEDHLQAEFHI